MAGDPDDKLALVAALGERRIDAQSLQGDPPLTVEVPGRPPKPELIHPRDVPKRGLGLPEGRAALIHAIAHIEFNAINLALDACYRFRDMPIEYYRDWLSVAQDEARHFAMLRQRLADYGFQYGDFTAHNGLWDAAVKTAHDVLVRMALVPRVLEARGLDVTPGMLKRLQRIGDTETAAILEVILEEEVPHVRIGSRWFAYCCQQRDMEPEATFRRLLREYDTYLSPPINDAARRQSGFSAAELEQLRVEKLIRE